MIFLLVLGTVAVLCVSGETSTAKYIAYNSSDLSYLSNGIQFPAPEPEDAAVIETSAPTNVSEMDWMVKLYDHHGWEDRIVRVDEPECEEEMSSYLKALKNGTLWAAKSKCANLD